MSVARNRIKSKKLTQTSMRKSFYSSLDSGIALYSSPISLVLTLLQSEWPKLQRVLPVIKIA